MRRHVRRTSFGQLIRDWRTRRRLTQMELAGGASLSTRHLSFLETGRAKPSRGTVLALAEQLAVPLRERNELLAAAGFAAVYAERAWSDPELAPVRRAAALVLAGHEPFPALVLDRHWNMVAHNAAVTSMLDGVIPQLLVPPINVLRITLDPRGLAPRIVNLPVWRRHLLARLERQLSVNADDILERLLEEVRRHGPDSDVVDPEMEPSAAVALPLELQTSSGVLSFISTTTVFGTPTDVTVSEVAIEAFYPADDATARALGVERQ